jgi:glycosyltransferase involved in cell wall biosynthesis
MTDPQVARFRVLSIAHSPAGAERARQLLAGVDGVELLAGTGGVRGALRAALAALLARAPTLYLVDVGKSTTLAALIGRLRRRRVIVDTGDACHALSRSLGDRNALGLALVGLGEQLALRCAHEIVVRGRLHAAHVPGKATHIPDIAPDSAAPKPSEDLRRELGIDDGFVVVLVGSLIFSERLKVSYGWDLVEALTQTAPEVFALIVGDGSGLGPLRRRAEELGVSDRCRFVGRVPARDVSGYVCAGDVAISTQTNDIVGQVRTSGKLPLYLACGIPVLATRVGEAARVLGPLGWTLRYDGVLDRAYPERLATAIEAWRRQTPEQARQRHALALRVASAEFDAATMRQRLAKLVAAEEPALSAPE